MEIYAFSSKMICIHLNNGQRHKYPQTYGYLSFMFVVSKLRPENSS